MRRYFSLKVTESWCEICYSCKSRRPTVVKRLLAMGKLLSLLARDESTCCTPKTYDVFLDFENAAPTDLEREVYEEVDRVLKQSEIVLDEIQCYKVRGVGVFFI